MNCLDVCDGVPKTISSPGLNFVALLVLKDCYWPALTMNFVVYHSIANELQQTKSALKYFFTKELMSGIVFNFPNHLWRD
jgi:hypothetical protein